MFWKDKLGLLRYFGLFARNFASRVAVLTRSEMLYYIMERGRSGASRLWKRSQRYASILFARNIRPIPIWTPSEDKPDDAPSRSLFARPWELEAQHSSWIQHRSHPLPRLCWRRGSESEYSFRPWPNFVWLSPSCVWGACPWRSQPCK